ncbi:MAG: glutathione peroxidase [Rhizobiaceae bacterium]
MTEPRLYDIPLKRLDGSPSSLGDYAGRVLLVVNVASKCGLTRQYEGLEALYRRYRDRGFTVLGFPSNDFMGQEPGTNAEIAEFCTSIYGVDFPMFEKISVTGSGKHPLYATLIAARPKRDPEESMLKRVLRLGAEPGAVRWNFEKFLVGRDGTVVARFDPEMAPEDETVVRAIEAALAA